MVLENLFFKFIGFDNEPVCTKCGSKKIEIIELNNKIITMCKSCGNEEELEIIDE